MLSCDSGDSARPPPLPAGAVVLTEVFVMAIQEYVRSIAATDTVSKAEVFRFLEMHFDELAVFAQSVASPEADQR
jgi:hypothetical protein